MRTKIDFDHFHLTRLAEPSFDETLPVATLTFHLHLPFLINADSPLPQPIAAGAYRCGLRFESAQRKTTFADGAVIDIPYTIAVADLHWDESARIPLREFIATPLLRYITFPLTILNNVIESYQIIQRDFIVFQLSIHQCDRIAGKIVLADGTELTFAEDLAKARRGQPAPSADDIIALAFRLLTNDFRNLSRKIFNNAERHLTCAENHIATIECCTVVELLVAGAVNVKAQGEKNRSLRQKLCNDLHPRLREAGQAAAADAIDPWLTSVYATRNRAVHAGHVDISDREAIEFLRLTAVLAEGLQMLHGS